MTQFLNRHLATLKPYQNGSHAEALAAPRKTLKLDSNESSIAPSPKVIASLTQAVQDQPLNWYPDVDASMLRQSLSSYVDLPAQNILAFNGSDHALETICRTYLSVGDEVILFVPGYDHFRLYAESAGAKICPQPIESILYLKHTLAQVVTPKTKLIYLVNPNNPTGHEISNQQISELMRAYPNVLFIVDEAYAEFAESSFASEVLKHPNALVTRSFSKAFALAGLRCGYVLANEDLIGDLNLIHVGKSVNAMAQIAANAALQDLDSMRRYVYDVKIGMQRFVEHMNFMGAYARATNLNFVLVQLAEPQKVWSALREKRIFVRDRSNLPGLEGCLRITIGDALTMTRLEREMQNLPREWVALPNAVKRVSHY